MLPVFNFPPSLRTAAIALAILSVSACTVDDSPGGEGKDNSSDALPARRIGLPLDSYMLDDFQLYKSSVLLRELSISCMKKYDHKEFTLDSPPEPGISVANERRYGITDGVLAAKNGYRVPEQVKEPDSGHEISPEEAFTLTGGSTDPGTVGKGGVDSHGNQIPRGGCKGQALKKLGYTPTGVPGNPQFVQDLSLSSFQESMKHPEVKDALSKWAACMSKSGYTYKAEPFSASNDPRFSTPEAGELEKSVAVADVSCKNSSGLIVAWQGVESAIQRDLIRKNQRKLEPIKHQRDITVRAIESQWK
ncbi:hypothetical protein [Streptomyces mesophilus]|uniref:hypothetical protein n=1 Tax=Streptomyces mesophilus TaxID=1775132 RepID=UPI003325781C